VTIEEIVFSNKEDGECWNTSHHIS